MVKIYLDGGMPRPGVDGYTTNPSLMLKMGIKDYREFAREMLSKAEGKPVSFEVTADELPEMERQAHEIASWGENVYVKIPVTNTIGLDTSLMYYRLSREGIKVNVTAVMTLPQIRTATRNLYKETPAIISIFAGRIADTGRDPIPLFTDAQRCKHAKTEILWASTRELYNITQASNVADIITVSPELFSKMHLSGKNLTQYSLETVQQFFNDGKAFQI